MSGSFKNWMTVSTEENNKRHGDGGVVGAGNA